MTRWGGLGAAFRRGGWLLPLILTSLVLLTACGAGIEEETTAPAAAPEPPPAQRLPVRRLEGLEGIDVVVLTLDACRADHASLSGYARPTTPTLDAIAAEPDAVIYQRHYVHGASTKPSTASLFTGLYTHQHGVHLGVVSDPGVGDGALAEPADRQRLKAQSLREGVRTLAELFREEGFTTLGVAKSAHLLPEYGFARGFDEYVSKRELSGDKRRVSKILEMIGRTAGPYFAYIHLNACHHPFRESERDPEFISEFGFDYPEAERQAAGIDFTEPDIKFRARRGELRLTEEDIRFLRLVYDAQYRRVDRLLVKPFVEGLRRMGRYENTLLIVTADHGEELYEHRGYAHGHSVMDEVTRVLMLVKFPDGLKPEHLPKRVDALTTNLDLMPSFLRLFGRLSSEEQPGTDLFTRPPGAPMQLLVSGRDLGVVTPTHKLVLEPDGTVLLFDLVADPGEQTDLSADHPQRVATLRGFAERMLALPGEFAPLEEREIDPELLESLRELGYIE